MRSLFLTALLTACTSAQAESVEEDVLPEPSGEVDLGCETDEDCAAYEICEEEGTTGDRSDGFSDAEDIVASIGRRQFGLWTHQPRRRQGLLALRLLRGEFIQATIDKPEIPEGTPDDALVPTSSSRSTIRTVSWSPAPMATPTVRSLTRTPCCTRT